MSQKKEEEDFYHGKCSRDIFLRMKMSNQKLQVADMLQCEPLCTSLPFPGACRTPGIVCMVCLQIPPTSPFLLFCLPFCRGKH